MPEHYPFEKTPLPYDYISLVPDLDPNTLYLHHAHIYCQYVDTLNYLLASYPDYQNWSLEQLIEGDLQLPIVQKNNIRHCAGGVYNHRMYFDGQCGEGARAPSGLLGARISADYGSFLNFQNLFKQAAYSVLGVGWVWLVSEGDGRVHIALSEDNEVPDLKALIRIFVLDVWEHAYFLRYPAQLGLYVENWFKKLNWERAEARYNMSLSSQVARLSPLSGRAFR